MSSVMELLRASRQASSLISQLDTSGRNSVLVEIARSLELERDLIIAENLVDLENAKSAGISEGLQDRIRLDSKRIDSLIASLESIAALPDPLGEVVSGKTLSNGLRIEQVRVPFGVIGAIYEARPNVSIDIAALSIKAGSAVVLRGGSAAIRTNAILVKSMKSALERIGLPVAAIETLDQFGREGGIELMQARGMVDLLIPRGSAELISTVVRESRVPVIETGDGVVHMYLDESANPEMAAALVLNSKTQRPSTCNALETLLVHTRWAAQHLPSLAAELNSAGVTLHGCLRTCSMVPSAKPATEETWRTEYYSLDLSIRLVDNLDEAMRHIAEFSTHHTESIITNDFSNAERFLKEVDSAVVMVNAATRFTDGGEFGFGAEVGISTQKLHVRGPMGLSALTSTKWLVRGSGQTRG